MLVKKKLYHLKIIATVFEITALPSWQSYFNLSCLYFASPSPHRLQMRSPFSPYQVSAEGFPGCSSDHSQTLARLVTSPGSVLPWTPLHCLFFMSLRMTLLAIFQCFYCVLLKRRSSTIVTAEVWLSRWYELNIHPLSFLEGFNMMNNMTSSVQHFIHERTIHLKRNEISFYFLGNCWH